MAKPKPEQPLPALADGSLPTVTGRVSHPDVGNGILAFTIPKMRDGKFVEWSSVLTPDAGGNGVRVRTKEVHPLDPKS